ncbi:YjbH domain-containing protein [Loktanella agnita]|uniref:YjbH domain-containing protein n=1 Tax=Loktanella agnita TaxID=287097 RepID=UPI00398A10A6
MRRSVISATSVIALTAAHPALAQDADVTYSLNGTPGLLEIPTAQSADEGALATTLSHTDGQSRAAFTFQLTDHLSGTLRYAFVDLYDDTATDIAEAELERGFDLRYRFNDETDYVPAIAIGLRDLLTPGRFGSEYLVATKTFGDDLIVTAGIGWGAMGMRDGFDNPFTDEPRPVFDDDNAEGQLASDDWFRGDAALFGGLEYQINEKWGFKAEYSSLDYQETPYGPALDVDAPYNIGVTYRPRPGVQLGLAALHGNQLALSGSFALNANNRPGMSGAETAPAPVKVRSAAERNNTSAPPTAALRVALTKLLEIEGITLTGLEVTETTARARYINDRYRSQAQAMGRVARMMTQIMPGRVDTFILEPESRGIPLSAARIARSDIERLENRPGAGQTLLQRTRFTDAGDSATLSDARPEAARWEWGIGPYFDLDGFGGGGVELDTGISLRGVYTFAPQLVLSGEVRQSVVNADGDEPGTDDTPDVRNVRSDSDVYGDDGIPVLQSLTLTHYARPGRDLYSRVSLGYLERMFGGLSTELLWKPVNSSFGVGLELNHVAQRDSDMAFGFAEYDYEVTTGHLSGYYDMGNGYHTQVDMGRYLAGDWGATLTLAKEYDNGVQISGYVTQTDLSYEDFGDGSYNKGVQITIPQDFLTGTATRSSYDATLRTQVGDGGARLGVNGRLYDIVRDAHVNDLSDTWGRFWR